MTTPRARRLLTAPVAVVVALAVTFAAAPAADAAPAGTTRYVVATTVARKTPATNARAAATMKLASPVVVVKFTKGWAKTTKGWVPSAALSTKGYYPDQLAAKYGLKVQYTDDQWCGKRPGVNTSKLIKVIGCSWGDKAPNTIQLSKSGMDRGTLAWKRRHMYRITMHEVAHNQIWRRNARPAKRNENVTDAYAWYFFHTESKKPGGYGFTAADLKVAKAIHAKKVVR